MTETEWLACTDPALMLKFLWGKASDRKIRLFWMACSRRFSHLPLQVSVDSAAWTAERFADGRASQGEAKRRLDRIQFYGRVTRYAGTTRHRAQREAEAVVYGLLSGCFAPKPDTPAKLCAPLAAQEAATSRSWALLGTTKEAEEEAQCKLLWEIVGNPFHAVAFDPDWLTWNDGAVKKLAQVIYTERRFGALPILADALEDAGCANADVLHHCRAGGEHEPGCWVVDRLLGMT